MASRGRLDADARPAVVSIVAAAGYGKTTLLRQWADRLPSMAYVALDERDSDPVLLVSCIAASLDRVERLDPAVLRLIGSPGQSLESTLLAEPRGGDLGAPDTDRPDAR